MDIEKILDLLEIDSPDEFEYFEHFAELMECDEYITFEDFYGILREVDSNTLNELIESYFDDIFKGIPDEAIDFYTLLSTIRQCLMGLCTSGISYDQRQLLVEELYRFRTWYVLDSVVCCKSLADFITKELPIVEALALYRLEKLGEEKYEYDFSDCLDYPLEEYIISFPFNMGTDDEEQAEDEEDYYNDSLIDKDFPVIDGEFSD